MAWIAQHSVHHMRHPLVQPHYFGPDIWGLNPYLTLTVHLAFQEGSLNHDTTAHKCQVDRLQPPTSTYNHQYLWGNTKGWQILREFINICRHPPVGHLLWAECDINVIETPWLPPTNTVNCLHPLTSITDLSAFVRVSRMHGRGQFYLISNRFLVQIMKTIDI